MKTKIYNLVNQYQLCKLFTILLFTILIFFHSVRAEQRDKLIIIDTVKVNGEIFSDLSQNLVISDQDSITFFYKVVNLDNNSGQYLFSYQLKDSKDSVERSTNTNFLSYKRLPEEHYQFAVRAFDLRGNWSAPAMRINFEVNNSESQLLKQYQSLKQEYQIKDSLMRANQVQVVSTPKKDIFNYIPIIVAAVFGIVIGFLVTLLLKNTFKNKNISVNMNEERKNTVNEAEYEKLLEENSIIKAELAQLRGQIDALNSRGDELKHQNYELQKSIDKMNSSKSELEELQKQKDELFAVIIHDIKNPVALIKSLVELLTSYDLSATEQQEIIRDIAETTTKIVSLSHEVSKILALESSVMKLNLDIADLRELVNDVYNRNLHGAKNKSISFFKELPSSSINANMDTFKVEEILENLVSNAIKFTQRNGTVRIKAYNENGNIIVEVSDNGLGLTEEDVANAFKRGQKLSAKPTAGENSTGLGLWIVKKLVQAHNGRVWVKSALGQGSTFAFSLPVKLTEKN